MAYTKHTFITDSESSARLNATVLNEMETGIYNGNDPLTILANLKTVDGTGSGLDADTVNGLTAAQISASAPLSDLSRVTQITGDGVPMFPDNVAGRTYWQDDWSTIDGWSSPHATLSVSNGSLVLNVTSAPNLGFYKSASFGSGKMFRMLYISSRSGSILVSGTVDGVADVPIKTIAYLTPNVEQPIDVYVPGNVTTIVYTQTGVSVGDVARVNAVYVGSGLYDTPVYDKSCCNRAINYGAFPVRSQRGLALYFPGNGYLQFDNPVLGASGSICFRYNRSSVNINEFVLSNLNYSLHKGIELLISSSQSLRFVYGSGTAEVGVTIGSNIVADGWHDYEINYTAITLGPVYKDGIVIFSQTALASTIVQTSSSLRVGCPLWGFSSMLSGALSDIRIDARQLTQAEATRYHNGDDAVDSQQKSITNVPYAIKICDAKGNLRQPGLPVYADNTAALAGGLVAGEPYRTSTGVLMVVF